MRLSSWFAALGLAAAVTSIWQVPAHSSDPSLVPGSWYTVVSADPAAYSEPLLPAKLGPDDPVAVLEAVDFALNEVADGATYVWHRTDGVLQGAVRPLSSYRNTSGALCRRLSVTLTFGATSRWTDTVACREQAGRWVVGG